MKYNSVLARKCQQKKCRKRPATIYRWLRERTSSIDYGMQWNGHPIHCNTNKEVLEAFNHRRWLSRMTNAKFDRHFSGEMTFYFSGNGNWKNPETLVLIDIDCHACGTLQGAVAFAEYLKQHHCPNLYYEVSTNGKGVHAYVVVQKNGLDGEFVNGLLRRLDHHLKGLLAAQDFDVENVEVKGTSPVLTWGERRGELTNYKSGQLGKLPRESHRFEELRTTTRISHFDLMKLPPVKQLTTAEGAGLPSHTITVSKKDMASAGSISGKHFGEDELSQLNGHYLHVAQTLMETHALSTTGKAVATAEDVTIFLMLLRFFSENMNKDGSLPHARFRRMWTALVEAGDVDRPFEDKRFAAIRNYLSDLGLLDWEDEHYRVGWTDHAGKHRGKACKWKAADLLMQLLDWQKATEANDQADEPDVRNSKEALGEEREEERASLAGTDLEDVVKGLTRSPADQTIRPILSEGPVSWRVLAEDLAAYITPFEVEPALAA